MQVFLTAVLFFFNDTATTEIYTLSLHDALPISRCCPSHWCWSLLARVAAAVRPPAGSDRKSTRLNSSHGYISYAVFCLKKKNPGSPHHRHEAAGPRPAPCHQLTRAGHLSPAPVR